MKTYEKTEDGELKETTTSVERIVFNVDDLNNQKKSLENHRQAIIDSQARQLAVIDEQLAICDARLAECAKLDIKPEEAEQANIKIGV